MKEEFIYKSTAMDLLGLTRTGFEKLDIKPVKEVPNPHYRSGAVSYLYSKGEIENLVGTDEVLRLRPKPRKPRDLTQVFKEKFSHRFSEEAISAAAEGMFNLNRYTKHPSCSDANKNEIYKLKNLFIWILHEHDFCKSVGIHKLRFKKQMCFRCGGTGIYEDKYYEEHECNSCDNGVYLPGKVIDFYIFEFDVYGTKYIWHQPVDSVFFRVIITEGTENINDTEIKPLLIKKNKLSDLKKLVAWVVGIKL